MKIDLSQEEALVLFVLLSRFSETDKLQIKHSAEKKALWNLNSLLQKELIESFQNDYENILNDARTRLRMSDE